ncbi:MAG TPA: hypothetical protein VMC85_19975 [Desulfomonilaceae bacterium]|nr:hypothetical protein [Desulfomonilaceae bacterium]
MLRRIPTTPLVYLVILSITLFVAASWAAGPEESMEILLKPSPTSGSPVPAANRARPHQATRTRHAVDYGPSAVYMYPLPPIMKVKPELCGVFPVTAGCILPSPVMGQWEVSAQAFFAHVRGTMQWPRNSWWMTGFGWGNNVGFTDNLQLPAHQTVGDFSISYQFRPNWSFRYSILSAELNGGGWPQDQFWFGWQLFSFGQSLQSKWTHYYSRLSLVYDAIHNCKAKVSVFAGWVHTDDKVTLNCSTCGFLASPTFSKNGDSMMVGLELQRCVRTFANGGTFSTDCKGAAIFIDDVEGWDAEAAGRYSVPLNCGRWGYVKGGYRLIDIKKSQSEFIFNHALEGGFVEFGLIF